MNLNKDTIIGIGLVGLPFVCIGTLIGGFVVNKLNDKYEKERMDIWKGTADFFKEQLLNQYEKNENLIKEIKSIKEEA